MLVHGGWAGLAGRFGDIWALDLPTMKWRRGVCDTVPRSNHCACALGPALYFFGGVVDGHHVSTLSRLVPCPDGGMHWDDLQPGGSDAVEGVSNCAAAAVGPSRAVFVGGWGTDKQWRNQVLLLDVGGGAPMLHRVVTQPGPLPGPAPWKANVVYLPRSRQLLFLGNKPTAPLVADAPGQPASLKECVGELILSSGMDYRVS
eukprot:Hpha_TRINITY_DN2872_c0_g2::TRINITY_DN2872_c0_g2_i1::g.171479::m.171479